MEKERGKRNSEEKEKRSEEEAPEIEEKPVIRSVRELEPAMKEVVSEAEEEEEQAMTSAAQASLEERAESAGSEVFEEEAGTPGVVVTPVLPVTGAVQAVPMRRLVAGGEEESERRTGEYAVAAGDVTGGRRSGAEFSVYETARRQEAAGQQSSYTVEQMPRAVAPVLNPTMNIPNSAEERAARSPLFRNPDLEQFEGQHSKYEYRRPEREREGEQRRRLPWQR